MVQHVSPYETGKGPVVVPSQKRTRFIARRLLGEHLSLSAVYLHRSPW